MRKLLISGLVLALSSSAFGGFLESEPNNTALTADPIVLPCNLSADVGLASLTPGGDNDYYVIGVPTGCIMTAIITPIQGLPGTFASPDTIMELRSPLDVLIQSNDDAGGTTSDVPGGGPLGQAARGSAIRFQNLGASGGFFLNVRGFNGQEVGQYLLTVSLYPEPATMSLLVGGLLLAARKARKA